MAELKIVATVVAKKGYQDDILKALQNVVDGTRKEEGNISYDLHQDVTNPFKFVIIEVWKSQDAIDSHNASSHFETFKQAIDGKIDGLSIDVIKTIY